MFESVTRARRGEHNIFAIAKLVHDELRVRCHRVETRRSAQAFTGHIRKTRRDVLVIHGGDLRLADRTRNRIGIDRRLVLLAGNLQSAFRTVNRREAVEHVARPVAHDPDEHRKSRWRVLLRIPCQPEPAQHLPIDPEVARVFRAQQLPDPRTGSYDHARGRVRVSVRPHLDRAMRFLMEVENDLRGEDLRAQLSRQIELRLDARLRTKKSRATLEVTNFIAAQSELRITATDFIRAEYLVRNAEFPGRADGVLDERG